MNLVTSWIEHWGWVVAAFFFLGGGSREEEELSYGHREREPTHENVHSNGPRRQIRRKLNH